MKYLALRGWFGTFLIVVCAEYYSEYMHYGKTWKFSWDDRYPDHNPKFAHEECLMVNNPKEYLDIMFRIDEEKYDEKRR